MIHHFSNGKHANKKVNTVDKKKWWWFDDFIPAKPVWRSYRDADQDKIRRAANRYEVAVNKHAETLGIEIQGKWWIDFEGDGHPSCGYQRRITSINAMRRPIVYGASENGILKGLPCSSEFK